MSPTACVFTQHEWAWYCSGTSRTRNQSHTRAPPGQSRLLHPPVTLSHPPTRGISDESHLIVLSSRRGEWNKNVGVPDRKARRICFCIPLKSKAFTHCGRTNKCGDSKQWMRIGGSCKWNGSWWNECCGGTRKGRWWCDADNNFPIMLTDNTQRASTET